ncbi:MAG: NAD-dependent deacetylase [Calditrichaceae bacterium]|nr:NAD-dependent deacetylase [Calditrichaceae bacterium]RQV95718.1 MAG: NAD-dependent deacetylase [Calditrichota bacterium]
MGVDSGLPDFRGNEGFWKAYPPIAKLGIGFAEMANPRWFETKPRLAWGFYGHRMNLYRNTIPHKGFEMLLTLGLKMSGGYFVFTSNVDGHFQKAGFDKEKIVECHGSIHHLQCTGPCCAEIWDGKQIKVEVDKESFEAQEPLPLCPHCGKLARPNVLMFGDWSWVPHRTEFQHIRMNEWMDKILRAGHKLLVIELGAGIAVPTVRYESENRAEQSGGILLRINPRDDQAPAGHLSLTMRALEGIEYIDRLRQD